MRDIERALADITALRSQLARGTVFRGYGPMTVAATGGLAGLAAGVQALWLPDPGAAALDYIGLWVVTAALAAALVGIEMVARTRRIHSGLADEMIHGATEQFIPAAVTGALVTLVLFRAAPGAVALLPGLWQILFSLGIFASSRGLPRAMRGVGVWYLGAGLGCLALAQDAAAFSPWAMALPFGVGQILMAAVLYWGVEHDDGQA